MTMRAALLDIVDLTKSFGGVKAVKGVNFTLGTGEILALIGPNGAGKSTCFNMLNGQIKPDAGSIRLKGEAVTGLPPRAMCKRGVGRTFQITNVFASMSVVENVETAISTHRGDDWRLFGSASHRYREDAFSYLDQVGLLPQALRPCSELAYGDLKRLEFAIALASEPVVLLMDEPTAGMAPKERIDLMRSTAALARARQISILFTEHDMDIVFEHADRVFVLDRGTIVSTGSPAEVRADPLVKAIYLGEGLTFAAQNAGDVA